MNILTEQVLALTKEVRERQKAHFLSRNKRTATARKVAEKELDELLVQLEKETAKPEGREAEIRIVIRTDAKGDMVTSNHFPGKIGANTVCYILNAAHEQIMGMMQEQIDSEGHPDHAAFETRARLIRIEELYKQPKG